MDRPQKLSSEAQTESKAGTGFMKSLFEITKEFQDQGYTENISAIGDHFKMGQVEVGPDEVKVDEVRRYQNTSDPADSSIVYAISVPGKDLKGLFIEPHGVYHDDVSDEIRDCLDSKKVSN